MSVVSDHPSWVAEGEPAAVYSSRGSDSSASVSLVTIKRVTKTQVIAVTAEGVETKFRSRRGDLEHDTGAWSATQYLLPRQDDRVVRAQQRSARKATAFAVNVALDEWADSGDQHALRKIIERLYGHIEEVA